MHLVENSQWNACLQVQNVLKCTFHSSKNSLSAVLKNGFVSLIGIPSSSSSCNGLNFEYATKQKVFEFWVAAHLVINISLSFQVRFWARFQNCSLGEWGWDRFRCPPFIVLTFYPLPKVSNAAPKAGKISGITYAAPGACLSQELFMAAAPSSIPRALCVEVFSICPPYHSLLVSYHWTWYGILRRQLGVEWHGASAPQLNRRF